MAWVIAVERFVVLGYGLKEAPSSLIIPIKRLTLATGPEPETGSSLEIMYVPSTTTNLATVGIEMRDDALYACKQDKVAEAVLLLHPVADKMELPTTEIS